MNERIKLQHQAERRRSAADVERVIRRARDARIRLLDQARGEFTRIAAETAQVDLALAVHRHGGGMIQ